MFPPARRRFSRTKPLRMTFPPVEGADGNRSQWALAAKTPLGRALLAFPASCFAELVSGGHLSTILGAHISAPAGPCILRQQNMERQVGRQG